MKKSALGQVHLGEEGCWKSQTQSITWKARKERVKPAALFWHMCTPLFVQGLSGKAHSFSPSAQHGNESVTVSHCKGTVQVQTGCLSLNRFYWGRNRRVNKGTLSPRDPGNLDLTAPRPVEDTSTSSSCFQEHCSGAPCSLQAL